MTPRDGDDQVRPGPVLAHALHAFDRDGHDRSHSLGAIAGLVVIVGALIITLSAVVGSVFLVGAGGAWLADHTTLFEHHPRLGTLLGAGIVGCIIVLAFLAGRMSAQRRPGSRS